MKSPMNKEAPSPPRWGPNRSPERSLGGRHTGALDAHCVVPALDPVGTDAYREGLLDRQDAGLAPLPPESLDVAPDRGLPGLEASGLVPAPTVAPPAELTPLIVVLMFQWLVIVCAAVGGGVISYGSGRGQRIAVAAGMTSPIWPTDKVNARLVVYGLPQ